MITTHFANAIMGNVFGAKTNISFPSSFYISLGKAAPNKDGTGCVEPCGTYDVTMLETVVVEGAIQTIPAAGLSF